MEDEKKSVLCRVCLNSDNHLAGNNNYSLFDQSMQLASKLSSIANINIKQDDGLPSIICYTCLLDLENAFNFQQKCITSNGILLSSLASGQPLVGKFEETIIKVEPDFQYDYLDEDALTVSEYLAKTSCFSPVKESHEQNLESSNTDDGAPSKKSRAIDLKLICDDCGQSFKSKCKIKVHWKKVHLKEKLICDTCKRQFTTFRAYHSHKKRKLASCATAGKVIIEGLGKSRVFYCKDCDYKSARIKDIGTHIVIHTGDRLFPCDKCPKRFTQQSSLQSHKEQVHKAYLKEGTCQYCGKYLRGRNSMYRHLKAHRGPIYPCKVCNKLLKTRSTFNQHMLRHNSMRNYYCEFCPGSFYTKSELYNHTQKVHLKNKYYNCNQCQFKCTDYARMKKHIARHCTNNVPCELCGMFLENNEQLTMHKIRHSDRNFECVQCERKYFTKKNLQSHIRKVHKTSMIVDTKPNVNNRTVKIEVSPPQQLVVKK